MNDEPSSATATANQYSLKELADASGVDERLIRFYIEKKMLPGPEGKARASFYTDAHLIRARAIRHLREVEKRRYPEILSLLATSSDDRLEALVLPQDTNLKGRIRALRDRLQSAETEELAPTPRASQAAQHKDLSGPVAKSRALAVSARVDRQLGWNNGGSVRHVVVSIEAIAGDQGASADPASARAIASSPVSKDAQPNVVAAVIDARSGAIRTSATRTLEQIIDAMRPEDQLAIIWADKGPVHALKLTAMDRRGKQAAREVLRKGHDAGSIDLIDCWLAAAEELSEKVEPAVTRRILVFTDAGTDRGENDPRQVARAAAELANTRIETVALGLGTRPDMALLLAMEGGGEGPAPVRFGETLSDLAEHVIGHHLTLRPIVARNCRLTVTPRLDGGIDSWKKGLIGRVGEAGATGAGKPFVIALGDLRAGSGLSIPVRLHFPGSRRFHKVPATRDLDDVEIQLTGEDVVAGKKVNLGSRVRFKLVPARENDTQPVDLHAARIVAISWLETVARRAIILAAEDRKAELDRLQVEQFRYFSPYVARLPEGAQLTAQFGLLFESLRSRWKRLQSLSLS